MASIVLEDIKKVFVLGEKPSVFVFLIKLSSEDFKKLKE